MIAMIELRLVLARDKFVNKSKLNLPSGAAYSGAFESENKNIYVNKIHFYISFFDKIKFIPLAGRKVS